MVNNGEKMPDNRYKVDEVANGKCVIMCKKCKKWYIPRKGISAPKIQIYITRHVCRVESTNLGKI